MKRSHHHAGGSLCLLFFFHLILFSCSSSPAPKSETRSDFKEFSCPEPMDYIGPQEHGDGLTKNEVYCTVDKYLPDIMACYERALVTTPDITGTLVIQFVIGDKGHVKSANEFSREGSLTDAVSECTIAKLTSWQFLKPRNGIEVGIKYPFLFVQK